MTDYNEYLATGFRAVDSSRDLGKLSACLHFIEELPSFASYKTKSIERLYLKSGDVAVDLGCGLGFDVAKLARVLSPNGKAIGVDASEQLLNAARQSFSYIDDIEFKQGDIHDLELPSNSIDGIRVDRVLQHVRDPQKVISEMVRVLKPEGWLVCAEPDWSTFVIDAEDDRIVDLVSEKWKNGFQNPWIGRQLLRRIREEKLQNTWVEGFVLLADGLSAVDSIYDLFSTVNKLKEHGLETSIELQEWVNQLRMRESIHGVTASVTLFLVGGQKAI
ncbi:MAG: methyltransferase domain-containing protein [Cyanobacteria bacterium P01_H01_bin.15]